MATEILAAVLNDSVRLRREILHVAGGHLQIDMAEKLLDVGEAVPVDTTRPVP